MDAKTFMLRTTQASGKIAGLGGAEGVETLFDAMQGAEAVIIIDGRRYAVERVSVKTDEPYELRIEAKIPSLLSRLPGILLLLLISVGIVTAIVLGLVGIITTGGAR